MRASGGERQCQEAREYYFDLLCHEEEVIPSSVREHVETCAACREQMRLLREMLPDSRTDRSPTASAADQETIGALVRQFQLLGEHVTCSDIKSFLPALALGAPQIRIPTPVTAHIDHCRPCAEDLASLSELHLTVAQWQRLGRLLGAAPSQNRPGDRHDRSAIEALGNFSFEGLDEETGEHISTCPQCRSHVYEERQRRTIRESEGDRQTAACNRLSATDLFDYVVPLGRRTPGEDQKAVSAHLGACPACRAKVQALHNTLYGIMERLDSGTITLCQMESHPPGVVEQADGPVYCHPIRVQVRRSEPEPAANRSAVPGVPTAREGGGSRIGSRAAAKMGLAAAAGVILAVLLWPDAPTASGTHAGDVLKVLAQAENTHIMVTDGENTPVQEFWIARHPSRLVHRTTTRHVLYDLDQLFKRTIKPQAGTDVSSKLSKIESTGVQRLMTSCLSDVLERISPDSKLQPVQNDTLPEALRGLDVYETSRSEHTDSSVVYIRWRAYLDPATRLPRRTELYQKGPRTTEWRLSTIRTFTYLTRPEMDESIAAMFPED